jgi:hypothetical protein
VAPSDDRPVAHERSSMVVDLRISYAPPAERRRTSGPARLQERRFAAHVRRPRHDPAVAEQTLRRSRNRRRLARTAVRAVCRRNVALTGRVAPQAITRWLAPPPIRRTVRPDSTPMRSAPRDSSPTSFDLSPARGTLDSSAWVGASRVGPQVVGGRHEVVVRSTPCSTKRGPMRSGQRRIPPIAGEHDHA